MTRDEPAAPPPLRPEMFQPRRADARTVVRAGVGVIVADDRNRVLLERRSDCGLWGLIGGRIDPGESVAAAAIREAREETGLEIAIVRLQGVYSDPAERIVTYPDNVVQLVDVVMVARIVSGTLAISAESLDLRFFAGDELPDDLIPPARGVLADWFAGRDGVVA